MFNLYRRPLQDQDKIDIITNSMTKMFEEQNKITQSDARPTGDQVTGSITAVSIVVLFEERQLCRKYK